jgi:hypothetical protein
MLLADFYKIPVEMALGVIAIILFLSVLASLGWPQKGGAGKTVKKRA